MQIHRELMAEPRKFGSTLRLHEESRDVWGWNWFDNLYKDVVYGLRQLRKTPGWTTLAVSTLAIAIGAITSFAGLMKVALFADLPVRHPEQLQQIVWSLRSSSDLARRGNSNFSYGAYRYVQAHSTSFSNVACWSNAALLNLRTRDNLVQVSTQFVSGNFFDGIGLDVARGRPISKEDDAANATPVSILSHGAWQRLFGGDQSVIGRQIALNGSPFVVIGVLANKELPRTPLERWDADIILPVSSYTPALVKTADASSAEPTCRIIGRVPPESSISRARQESEKLVLQAFQAHPLMRQGQPIATDKAFVDIRGLRTIDQQVGLDGAPVLVFLMIASLLAIVCSNIAGMMLARGSVRRGEVATRLALGGGRRRIIRQLLTESLLLAAIGGGIGLGLSFVARNLVPWGAFPIDVPVLAITLGCSCMTGLVFGLVPALTSTRLDLTSVMKGGTPGALGRTFRSGNVLIAVQITLSFLLLVAAGLQIRSLMWLMVPTDFAPQQVLTIRSYPRSSGYSAEQTRVYFEEAVRRLGNLPGVTSATASSGDAVFTLISTGPGAKDVSVIGDHVAPRFFETVKIPILLGRDTAWTDREGAPLAVVVNETFARTLFPETPPLGKRVQLHQGWAEIIGVVADSNNSVGDAFGFGQAAQPAIYIPFQQRPDGARTMMLSARVNTDAAALLAMARKSVQDLDPDVVVDPAETQANQRNIYIRERRLVVGVLSGAALVALLEVSFGLYGLLSFFVGTRVSEIGLRVALGARRIDILRMVLRQSCIPVAIGTLIGLAGAPALVRVLASGGFLVGVIRISDEVAIGGAAIFLLGISLTAALAPARRASRAQPMQALRHE
jgi:predicted permease